MSQTDISKRENGEVFTAYKAFILQEDGLGSIDRIELGIYPFLLRQNGNLFRRKDFHPMKVRLGFVSNSSSSSYVINNKTDKDLSLADLIRENSHLAQECDRYSPKGAKWTLETLIQSAKESGIVLKPGSNLISFSDADEYNAIEIIGDYEMREGGDSERFSWSIQDCHGTPAYELFEPDEENWDED